MSDTPKIKISVKPMAVYESQEEMEEALQDACDEDEVTHVNSFQELPDVVQAAVRESLISGEIIASVTPEVEKQLAKHGINKDDILRDLRKAAGLDN